MNVPIRANQKDLPPPRAPRACKEKSVFPKGLLRQPRGSPDPHTLAHLLSQSLLFFNDLKEKKKNPKNKTKCFLVYVGFRTSRRRENKLG